MTLRTLEAEDASQPWPEKRFKWSVREAGTKDDRRDATPYIALENIESWTGRFLESDDQAEPEGVAARFTAEDVLFAKLRPYLAKVLRPDFSGRCSTELLVFRSRELDRDFLFWWCLSDQFIRAVDATTYGTKMPRANWADIGKLPLKLPPRPAQRAIADFLDRKTRAIDELIRKKERLIELLQVKRQALITQAVTKGLDPNVPMKDSGVPWLGEIPAHWEVVQLKRLARSGYKTFTDGDWVEAPFITDSGVRLIQTGNVGIGEYREKGFRYVSQETFRSLRCTEIGSGDVLICRLDGPVGRACLVPDLGMQMITSVDNAILKPDANVDPRYVVHLLSAPQYLDWVQSLCRVGGGHRFRISRTMLGEFRLPHPPSAEQKRIADCLDQQSSSMLRLREKIWTQVERLREYRQALISAAVTGQIDVTAEAAA